MDKNPKYLVSFLAPGNRHGVSIMPAIPEIGTYIETKDEIFKVGAITFDVRLFEGDNAEADAEREWNSDLAYRNIIVSLVLDEEP